MLQLEGSFHQVRVVSIKRGQHKLESLLYYGLVDQLRWDHGKFIWPGPSKPIPLMDYNTKLGQDLLRKKHVVLDVIEHK